MTFNDLLVAIVCISCLVLLGRVVQVSARQNLGWIVVSGGILAITVTLYLLAPNIAGLVGGLLWALLVLIPLIGFNKVNSLIYQQKYDRAQKLASLLQWLHPSKGWRDRPKILEALKLGQQGKMTQAGHILERYSAKNTPQGRYVTVLLYWMSANWDECRLWFESLPPRILEQEPNLISYSLRSLGETGDINGLLQELVRLEDALKKGGNPHAINLVRLIAFSFSGQVQQVQTLLNNTFRQFDPRIAQFWQLTALMATGQVSLAREQLTSLQQRSGFILQNAIEWRLSSPPQNALTILSPTSQQILAQMQKAMIQETRDNAFFQPNSKTAYGTYSLVAINLIAFGLEIAQGGSTNLEALFFLGALVPEVVWAGEWWRVITANFLHFGAVHLTMNMIGLYFIGPFVENILGIRRYLLCYFISGVGAMAMITVITVMTHSVSQILVGASGAIMGLVGAMAAISLQTWRRERTHLAAKRLRFILFIIGLQFVFDFLIPQVSIMAHAFGVILGFISASILLRKS